MAKIKKTYSLDEELADKLQQTAEDTGLSVSAMLNLIIANFYKTGGALVISNEAKK